MWRPLLAITALLNLAGAFRVSEPTDPWPTELYRTSSVFGTSTYSVRNSKACKDGLYTFLSPRGEGVAARGPTILDQEGELVWTTETSTYGAAYNLDVQEYKGNQYLAFWEGDDKVDGHGDGTIHMLDQQYIERYQIRGPSSAFTDWHEFQITRNDTALFTVHDVVSADLRAVRGPERGWIWDSRFVEVDIETNKVLFQWRASEHFNFTDVEKPSGSPGWSYGNPWDFFHLHSIDKDAKGNYLISALHTDYLTYLDGRTGEIIWRLGGNHTDFYDLSTGRASTFAWPHDARFHDDDKAITLLDNTTPGDKVNRGLIIDVDQSSRNVSLRSEFRAFGHAGVTPESQPQSDGSVQVLDNGHILVSYGRNGAAWTEFSKMGVPMCHTQFGSISSFGTGSPASYRVRKHPWIGKPDTTPAFEINGHEAAVSWNGATEVRSWVLEGARVALPIHNTKPDEFEPDDHPSSGKTDYYFSAITTVPKSGFETIIHIPFHTNQPYLRVRALDKEGQIIGTSAILPFNATIVHSNHPPQQSSDAETDHFEVIFFASCCAAIGLGACIYFFGRRCWAICLRSCRCVWLRRYRYLYPGHRDGDEEDNWEEYYGGLHIASDTESDDSDVEISDLDNPRLSPALLSPDLLYPGMSNRPSWQSSLASPGSSTGRPGLVRTPSTHSNVSLREKQH
ncbi:arylsulfotransferase family protein [Aspergillus foveolatus]|uniref:arylsulfotransferase family protein n=1 Tax=Aspergillus foveolatus TaxID=210207 RepID=UPI003CCD34B8